MEGLLALPTFTDFKVWSWKHSKCLQLTEQVKTYLDALCQRNSFHLPYASVFMNLLLTHDWVNISEYNYQGSLYIWTFHCCGFWFMWYIKGCL
jgi:hypothetical protein